MLKNNVIPSGFKAITNFFILQSALFVIKITFIQFDVAFYVFEKREFKSFPFNLHPASSNNYSIFNKIPVRVAPPAFISVFYEMNFLRRRNRFEEQEFRE